MVSQRPVLRISWIACAVLVVLAMSRLSASIAGGREGVATAGAAFSAPWVNIVLSGAAHEARFAVAVSSQRGVAVGSGGSLMASSDAGACGRHQASPTTLARLRKGDASLCAMELRDDGVGYAVGQSGTILRTLDRGSTWNVLPSVSNANLLGVYSASDGDVVATGMRDMLISGDGGDTWRHVATGDTTTSWYAGVAQAGPTAPIVMVGHAGQIAHVGR